MTSTGLVSQLQEIKVDGRSPSTKTEPIAARNCTPSRYAFAQSTSTVVAQPFTTVETRGPHFSAELVMTPNQPPPVAIGRPPQHRMDATLPALPSCSCDFSVCTTPCTLCATVEIGPNLPAELVMTTVLHQPPLTVMNETALRYRLIDAPPPAARCCNCDCSACTKFCPSFTAEIGPSSPAELAVVSHQSQVVQQRIDAFPPAPQRCSCDCLVCTRFCRSCINQFRPCMSASHTPIVEENTGQNHITSCQLCPRWMTLPVQESLSGYDGPSALV